MRSPRWLFSRRPSASHIPPGIPEGRTFSSHTPCFIFHGFFEARRGGTRYTVFDSEWHPRPAPQSLQTENLPEFFAQPEPPPRGTKGTRGRKRAPRAADHEHSGMWNADQHPGRRPAYDPSPSLSTSPPSRNVPPTPQIPLVPLPEAGITSGFGQPPNAPWRQPNVFLPSAQRTSQELLPDPIWQPNRNSVTNHIPPVALGYSEASNSQRRYGWPLAWPRIRIR